MQFLEGRERATLLIAIAFVPHGLHYIQWDAKSIRKCALRLAALTQLIQTPTKSIALLLRKRMENIQHLSSSLSSIPYVVAMVRYPYIAGKTWEALYGVKALTTSRPTMVKYVVTVVYKLINTADEDLQYAPE
ncbi:Uncharacterized protein HZ326_27147 [Fusarium oxysporum f. sp. albedinis]|nr:Uncharacterized protein HZ326_27147 [Fusarium oxysporum f. sp. albedinis]